MLDTRNTLLLSALLVLSVSVSAFVEELDNTFLKTKGDDEIWLIEFYAPWCTVCEQLDPVWHQIGSEFKSLGSPVNVGKTDAMENSDLSKEFKIRNIPTIIM
ncbi:protein disulfide-isomerase TMX3-like [Perca flavescens]|uniref:protein disulfide-isomerase TMX3-like n=1 Tax=Perca flavescens TaxID=8167 RepID=UPI00106DEFA2|nr:protein disulfide-isomerase TMX3-like [Perca flavescens]